jgi:hypothetical protein
MSKARKTAPRPGLKPLIQRVNARGMAAVDGRTKAMRAVTGWKQDLVRDLGGDPSAQRLTLVDLAAKTMLYLNHIDAWLMQQDSLLNKRKRSILPVLRERQTLCGSLARLLGQLGLDRVERDGGSIPAEWIEKVRPREEQEVPELQQDAVAPEPDGEKS